MECSWGRLAGIHIPMGTLKQGELWDTKRQMCGSYGANCEWSKVSEKCTERHWPEDALQRTSYVSALAHVHDTTETTLLSSFLQLPRSGMAQATSRTAADGSSLKEFHQRVPLLQLIFILIPFSLILKKMTSGECAQPPLPYFAHPHSFLCPSAREGFKPSAFSFSWRASLYHLKPTPETRWVHQNSHIKTPSNF